ncbi:hypothetical protein DM01DRAFT_1340721 [Hesseltinella vesiculosa]|uniref:RRM domain-containing protein n=1 Tax=Hesseltinella vesiculosa TaxID=101127 RepID=A0A1X2G3B2_9FUNG|nr:hypothetical protein DM01DRAFT_1340721 [Hesseltinella vesiculosa]
MLSESELEQYFRPFGAIIQVRIPGGKGCAFVQYAKHEAARQAIESMDGYQIGHSRIRLAWGRTQLTKTSSSATGYSTSKYRK